MHDSADTCSFGAFILMVVFGLGFSLGASVVENSWRKQLVDKPDYVAAIKSSVLAQRAEERALGGR